MRKWSTQPVLKQLREPLASSLAGLSLVTMGVLASATGARAESAPAVRFERVRAAQPELRELLGEGLRRSETFRHLVDDIHRSNWTVYLQPGPCPVKGAVACLLHVIGEREGRRYLRVLVSYKGRHPDNVIATIAHELQHVVEVTEASAITDTTAIQELFRAIGTIRLRDAYQTAYETDRALAVGARVQRELRSHANTHGDGPERTGS